jgi:hypothetical protein
MVSDTRAAEIESLRRSVSGIGDAVNAIGIVPRDFDLYPFDMMGLGILSKGFGISKAAVTMLESDFDDEAFGFVRSLVECSLVLRYLTEDRHRLFERTRRYMEYAVADKQYWIYWARQVGMSDEVAADIDEYAKSFGLVEDHKTATRHWAGEKGGFAWDTMICDHPMDAIGDHKTTKKALYALEYHQTSSYVHCLSTGIDNYLPREGVKYQVTDPTRRWDILYRKVLVLILRHIHSCAIYTLHGMNIDRPESIDHIYSAAVKELPAYVPMRKR